MIVVSLGASRLARKVLHTPEKRTRRPFFLGYVVLALLCVASLGCSPKITVRGLVTNIQGEPLPGVSVKVEAAQAFGVTNGNGIFGTRPNTVGVDPGEWELVYIKSGFTTATQTIRTGDSRTLEVPDVMLWPLPAAKGVYILDGTYYEPLTRVTPERYTGTNRRPVFGMKQSPELGLESVPASFISHKMASYDWAFSRLQETSVLRPGVEIDAAAEEIPETHTESIWAEAVQLPMDASPVDLPERQLWRLTPAVALGPGVYAIHWGALEGDATTEESAYLFRIIDPDAEAAAAAEEAPPEGQEPAENQEPAEEN